MTNKNPPRISYSSTLPLFPAFLNNCLVVLIVDPPD